MHPIAESLAPEASEDAPPSLHSEQPGAWDRPSRSQIRRARFVALHRARRATSFLTAAFTVWIAQIGILVVFGWGTALSGYRLLFWLPDILKSALVAFVSMPAIAISSLVAFLAFVVWLYLSYEVARRHLDVLLEFTASAAAGWCFCPFANFWQPYRAVRDLYSASEPSWLPNPVIVTANPDASSREPVGAVEGVDVRLPRLPVARWWTAFLAGIAATQAREGGVFALVMFVSLTVSAYYTIVVARAMQERLHERARRFDVEAPAAIGGPAPAATAAQTRQSPRSS